MTMIGANEVLALLSIITLLVILRGLVRWAFDRDRSETMHFALGVSALIWAMLLRIGYWDVTPVVVEWVWPGQWLVWGTATGWTKVNVIFDILLLFGGYHLLRAMQMLIPEAERADWPLWRAPFYPHGHLFERFWRWMRGR